MTISKDEGSNSGTMNYKLSPGNLPVFEKINWTSVISLPSPDVTVKSVTYDPSTERLKVEFDYSATLESDDL